MRTTTKGHTHVQHGRQIVCHDSCPSDTVGAEKPIGRPYQPSVRCLPAGPGCFDPRCANCWEDAEPFDLQRRPAGIFATVEPVTTIRITSDKYKPPVPIVEKRARYRIEATRDGTRVDVSRDDRTDAVKAAWLLLTMGWTVKLSVRES